MQVAALVGANHAHQHPGSPHGRSELFASFLIVQATSLDVDLIAEEMSVEALARANVNRSTVQEVALSLRIPHLFCDPNEVERKALGIPNREELKKRRNITRVFGAEEQLLVADEKSYWPTREQEWLTRLRKTRHNKVLFVHGPDHVITFAQLLERNGYEVQLLCQPMHLVLTRVNTQSIWRYRPTNLVFSMAKLHPSV